MRFLGAQLDDGSVSQRRAAKLDVKPQNDPLHNYHDRVALSWWFLVHCPSLSCFLFSSTVRWWLRVRPVEGEMLLEGQWGKAAEDRPAYVATAPSIGETRRAWSASLPLKWYPHSFVILRSASSQPGGEQSLVLQRHILTCSATKYRFITLQSSSCQPDDAVTKPQSSSGPSTIPDRPFLGRHQEPLWEGNGDYWLKDELMPHLEGASVAEETEMTQHNVKSENTAIWK